jgi:serine/threonine-protein phosphatase PP1 catalytic subunit
MSQLRGLRRSQVQKADAILAKLARFGEARGAAASAVTEQELLWLVVQVKAILIEQPTLLRVDAPAVICGDIHGQFLDLLRVFEIGGSPAAVPYVFLGDYVDRGPNSIEVIAYLFSMKVKFPERMCLLRGNHETAEQADADFFNEFKARQIETTWYAMIDVFRWLPIAAVVGRRIFCVHGGISPDLKNLSQIEALKRPLDISEQGLLLDLLWSDPAPSGNGWQESERGTSWAYGPDVVDDFLRREKLDLLCRAHQNVDDGFEFPFGEIRNCVTVFSAPDYCETNNYGAVMKVDADLTCSFEYLEPSEAPNDDAA